jgi:hypothetical protein
VVERVDLVVAALADVASARVVQRARGRTVRAGGERQSPRLVVDAPRRAGRRGGGHGTVVGEDRRAPLRPAPQLDGLEDRGGRVPHGDGVGMLDRQGIELGEYAQARLEIGGSDAVVGTGRHCRRV